MNKTLIALTLAMLGAAATSAFAQATPAAAAAGHCEAHAAEKKLAGAAKNSFMKKCEREAGAAQPNASQEACEKTAAEKKLAGAARNSFVTKCVKDAGAAK
jgi:hypothetical protein